jgi:hypothetical protein
MFILVVVHGIILLHRHGLALGQIISNHGIERIGLASDVAFQ